MKSFKEIYGSLKIGQKEYSVGCDILGNSLFNEKDIIDFVDEISHFEYYNLCAVISLRLHGNQIRKINFYAKRSLQ